MRTASAEKRGVLAAVTAKGLTDAEANLDELTILQRTAAEVEEYDMAVLTEIAKPLPDLLPELDPGAIVWGEAHRWVAIRPRAGHVEAGTGALDGSGPRR